MKKQNEELNKKIIELNYELKNEKEKNNSILDEKNILKEENNKLDKERNELKLNCNKLNGEISILNKRINGLNIQIKNKQNENENLSNKISSIIKAANEKFEQTKEIFEQNVHDLIKDNKSWRKTYEKFLGKKKLEEEGKKVDTIQESSISLQKKIIVLILMRIMKIKMKQLN